MRGCTESTKTHAHLEARTGLSSPSSQLALHLPMHLFQHLHAAPPTLQKLLRVPLLHSNSGRSGLLSLSPRLTTATWGARTYCSLPSFYLTHNSITWLWVPTSLPGLLNAHSPLLQTSPNTLHPTPPACTHTPTFLPA